MTKKIVKFPFEAEKPEGEYFEAEAICASCGNKWIAVTPIGKVNDLECPACKTMKGNMINPVGGGDKYPSFMCECGSFVYSVYRMDDRRYVRCYNCGLDHTMAIFED